jgi:hypothetical protein
MKTFNEWIKQELPNTHKIFEAKIFHDVAEAYAKHCMEGVERGITVNMNVGVGRRNWPILDDRGTCCCGLEVMKSQKFCSGCGSKLIFPPKPTEI